MTSYFLNLISCILTFMPYVKCMSISITRDSSNYLALVSKIVHGLKMDLTKQNSRKKESIILAENSFY